LELNWNLQLPQGERERERERELKWRLIFEIAGVIRERFGGMRERERDVGPVKGSFLLLIVGSDFVFADTSDTWLRLVGPFDRLSTLPRAAGALTPCPTAAAVQGSFSLSLLDNIFG